MLTGLYITLRFGHFISLMLAFGCVLYGAWWAPVPLRRVLMLRFYPLLRPLLLIGAISTLALYLLQGGMMGEGWTDVWRPAVWQAVAGTRFGGVWIWQILLAWIALAVVWIRPRHGARQLVALLAAQLLLSAGVGHAAMHDGLTGVLQRTNHAVHLFCVASWFGGLLPFIYCLRLAQGALAAGRGLYHGALFTLRASGRRRHDCQRSAQCAVDPGRIDWRIAVGTHVVDQMCAGRRDGGNCVSEQVCSGTAHVGKRFAGGKPDPANHAG